jgi:hypothetical protein
VDRSKFIAKKLSPGTSAPSREPDVDSPEWRQARERDADVREIIGDGEVSEAAGAELVTRWRPGRASGDACGAIVKMGTSARFSIVDGVRGHESRGFSTRLRTSSTMLHAVGGSKRRTRR